MSMHLPKHYEVEIGKLKNRVLGLSARVEEAAHQSVLSLVRRDELLAKHVIEMDEATNEKEVEIEEECLKILALYQVRCNGLEVCYCCVENKQ